MLDYDADAGVVGVVKGDDAKLEEGARWLAKWMKLSNLLNWLQFESPRLACVKWQPFLGSTIVLPLCQAIQIE